MAVAALQGIDTVILRSQQITDGASVSSTMLDTQGAHWATIRLNLGTEEGTDATTSVISLLESDDKVATNFATVVANQNPSLVTGQEVRYECDLRGSRKRYLQLQVTAGTQTASNMDLGAIATLSRNVSGPSSTTALGDDIVIVT